ncbi:MAG TPA: TerC family protein [Planctomycetota bacterium]|nr:TerC family protein [Planctomycetota bacterium]
MSHLFTAENALALLTLTAMEIVLGIDNIVFISILTGKLPAVQRPSARRWGLGGAMLTRILLLLCITWVMGMTAELFGVLGHPVTGRDLVLLLGGLFLIGKATFEIHERIEGHAVTGTGRPVHPKFSTVILQIMVLDIVFSLDSVITAVGMANELVVMVAAVVLAMGVMLASSGKVSDFVEHNPTIKMLALSFLLLIGVMLVADGCGQHIPKGYVYFAMAFSLLVETLNLRAHKVAQKRGAEGKG